MVGISRGSYYRFPNGCIVLHTDGEKLKIASMLQNTVKCTHGFRLLLLLMSN